MKISAEQHGKVTILRPQGNLTIGEGDMVLRESVQSALKAGNKLIVLDMKEVKYVDSAGLGELVASLKSAMAAGGSMKLSNLNETVNILMVYTKLVQVFEIHPTEVEAIASFV
jgi:anti-sigma B factor antagonist